jgi:hypothetical protein
VVGPVRVRKNNQPTSDDKHEFEKNALFSDKCVFLLVFDFRLQITKTPLNSREIMAEDFGVPIHLVIVTQRTIKHAALAVVARP